MPGRATEWSVEEIATWLTGLQVDSDDVVSFEEEEVDGAMMMNKATYSDLEELGVSKKYQRAKIIVHWKKLVQSDTVAGDGQTTAPCGWSDEEVAAWLAGFQVPLEVTECIKDMGIDGATMNEICRNGDHGSLKEIRVKKKQDRANIIAQWKTLAPSDGDGAGGGQTAPPEAPAPTAQAPSVLLSKSDQTPIKNWLEHKLADAVAAVAEVNIPGDSCSCAVEWVGTKFTYDGDFVTRACQQSASKTAAKMSADNKTVDAAGVACALAKRLEAELQARLPLDQLWGVSCNALGQVRVSFLGSAAEVASRVRPQILLEQKAPEAALEADGVVAARDATVHNLNAVNAALYHMVEALRPFMHQFLPQFFDHCKAESATSGASMHHVVLSLATGKSMADITALTNEEHGKSRDYFVKHINGNDKQTPEDYNFDIANWFEVQAPEYASLIHSLH